MPSATRINAPIFFPKQIYEIKLYDHWVFNFMYILATAQKTQIDTTAAEIDTLLHPHSFLPAVIRS